MRFKNWFTVVFLMFFVFLSTSFAASDFRLGTGKETGVYFKVDMVQIKRQVNRNYINIIPVPEKNGTPELIAKIKRGELDGAVIQYDGLVGESSDVFKVVAELHDEFVYLLVKENSKIKAVNDLTEKDTIAIGSGGSALTWSRFCKLDEKYAKMATIPTSGALALADLNSGKIQAVLMVGGIKLGDMQRANENKGQYQLVKVDDWNFNNLEFNGTDVYKFDSIDDDVFPNLISGWSVKTIKTSAIFVVSSKWIEENEGLFDYIYDGVTKAIPNIKNELINN